MPFCQFVLFFWIAPGFLSDGHKCCSSIFLCSPLAPPRLSSSPPPGLSRSLSVKHCAGAGSDTVNCHSLTVERLTDESLISPNTPSRLDDWQEAHFHTEFKWEASGEETLSVSNIHTTHTDGDTHSNSAWWEKCDLPLLLRDDHLLFNLL